MGHVLLGSPSRMLIAAWMTPRAGHRLHCEPLPQGQDLDAALAARQAALPGHARRRRLALHGGKRLRRRRARGARAHLQVDVAAGGRPGGSRAVVWQHIMKARRLAYSCSSASRSRGWRSDRLVRRALDVGLWCRSIGCACAFVWLVWPQAVWHVSAIQPFL